MARCHGFYILVWAFGFEIVPSKETIQFKEDFVFALMKCSYAAFGEQNKTDNDSKCQQVYKP